MTQHPLDDTVSDFWNMIWDQNSIGIVLLSTIDDTVSYAPYYFDHVLRCDRIDRSVFFLLDFLLWLVSIILLTIDIVIIDPIFSAL